MPFSSQMHTDCESCLGHRILSVLSVLHHSSKAGNIEPISNQLFDFLFMDSELNKYYSGKSHQERLKKSLRFLRVGCKFSTPSRSVQLSFDCPRFFFSILEKLRTIDREVLCCKEQDRWETYALLTDHTYNLLKMGIDHEKFINKIIGPLRDEFEKQHPWDTKTALIKSLKGVVYNVFENDVIYWTCCEIVLAHCYAAASCFRKGDVPEGLISAAREVVDLWKQISWSATQKKKELEDLLTKEEISNTHIRDIKHEIKKIKDITEEKVIGSSVAIIRLIDRCQLQLNLGIERYILMLRNLGLNTITAHERLMGKKPRRKVETEKSLLRIYNDYVFRMWNEPDNVNYKSEMIEDLLIPYLLGQRMKSDRRQILDDNLKNAELTIGKIGETFRVTISDICGKTGKVFRIVTDKIEVSNPNRVKYPIQVDNLNKVKVSYNNVSVVNRRAILDIPYMTSKGTKRKFSANCELISIDKKERSYSILLWTRKKRGGGWQKYVEQLPKAGIYSK